jgi:hypothetical protein
MGLVVPVNRRSDHAVTGKFASGRGPKGMARGTGGPGAVAARRLYGKCRMNPVGQLISLFEHVLFDLAGAVWFWACHPPWHGLAVILAVVGLLGVLLRKPRS